MTDCYALLFHGGATALYPAAACYLVCVNGVWEMYLTQDNAMQPVSEVWYCPSPAVAARLLRELAGKAPHFSGPGELSTRDCVCIFRNPPRK